MTKRQEKMTLKNCINDTGMHDSIQNLKRVLSKPKRIKNTTTTDYLFEFQKTLILRQLADLEHTLQDLIRPTRRLE